MNDFTKEELIWLEEDIRYSLEEYRQPEIAYEIHKKLKSMIDNYCGHDSKIIKIEKRKCPLCSSEFEKPFINDYEKVIIDCSNNKCGYFQGFPLKKKNKNDN